MDLHGKISIPFKFSSADTATLKTTEGGVAADTLTTSTSGTTSAITYDELEVLGVELDGDAHVSAAPLTGHLEITSVKEDGGMNLILGAQRGIIKPVDAVNGNVTIFVPCVRKDGGPVILEKSQTSTVKVGLSAYVAKSASVVANLTAKLICRPLKN